MRTRIEMEHWETTQQSCPIDKRTKESIYILYLHIYIYIYIYIYIGYIGYIYIGYIYI